MPLNMEIKEKPKPKLIIFTTCKKFLGDDKWRQEQAIKSWTLLKGMEIKIVIIGNDEGTTEICEKYNLLHEPKVKSFVNMPYLKSMFEIAYSHADDNDYIMWTNSDMIYYNDLIKTILKFDIVRKSNKLKEFLLVGGRHDWHNPKQIDDLSKEHFLKNIHINEEKRREVCQTDSNFYECSEHETTGIDYIIHSKTTLINKFDEKLVIGGPRFDMILLGVGLTNGYFCCDCTKTNFVIHQNHGYPKDFRGYGQINKETKDKRQILLNILISNNHNCQGVLCWIHQCPILTHYKNNNIEFLVKKPVQ
tara:strand:+ start:4881 stop:5795 length:915 start_codon:yes stop_codon:yes gene_type:complete